jgi:hypothetical protein
MLRARKRYAFLGTQKPTLSVHLTFQQSWFYWSVGQNSAVIFLGRLGKNITEAGNV